MSQIARHSTLLSDEQVRQYREQGYCVVRAFVSADEVREIRDAFMAQAANGPVEGLSDPHFKWGPDDPLTRYPRMMHPHRHPDRPVGPIAMRHMLDPRLGEILHDLFEDEPVAAQSMFYFKPPGARGQGLHQDNFYLRVQPGTCIAAWLAVDDADRENGGMIVVPGSHNMEIVCPEPSNDQRFFSAHQVQIPPGLSEAPVDLKAGDMLFFHGSLIHGSYPNSTPDRYRRALIFHYVPMGCIEVGGFYRPLLRFDGQEIGKELAAGGGPCGEAQKAVVAPH